MSNPLIVLADILECCDDDNLDCICEAVPDSYCDTAAACSACPFYNEGNAKQAAKAIRFIGEKIKEMDDGS